MPDFETRELEQFVGPVPNPPRSVPRPVDWRLDEPSPDSAPEAGFAWTPLVNLHYLRSALRRRRAVWRAMALIGLLIGLAAAMLVPPSYSAVATLLLTHDPQDDPARAMATDISLLQTRAVARQALDTLRLPGPEDAFLGTVTAEKSSDQVLRITVSGPSPDQATLRADAVAKAFLSFRSSVLTSRSDVVVAAVKQRMDGLNADIARLTERINGAGSEPGQSNLSDLVGQRTQDTTRVSQLQDQVDTSTLQNASIVSTSRVLDEPAAKKQSSKKRLLMDPIAGLIAGAALGVGAVVLAATVSYRARRREDVATALGAPVPVSIAARQLGERISAGLPGPIGRAVGKLLGAPTPARSRDDDPAQTLLVRRLEEVVDGGGPIPPAQLRQGPESSVRTLVLASVDSTADCAGALLALARARATRGATVLLVDLSARGVLARRAGEFQVHRPAGQLSLVRGPLTAGWPEPGARTVADQDEQAATAFRDVDVALVLADIDLALGADSLRSWATDAVVGVTAGNSTVEQIHSAAEIIRGSGVTIQFGVLFQADATDESLGLPRKDADADATQYRLVGE